MIEISGYTLKDKIGEGGMATVYKGVQVSLNRAVAIKVLSKKLIEHSVLAERFKRESVIIARLAHPNIIHVIDRGLTLEGMPFFVMEYIEGTDLAATIKEGAFNFNRKLDLVIQICKALSYAHKNGVIHRDIKPSNVLIDREGNARMLDFGIAQFYAEEEFDTTRTQSGVVMGTLPYMSPEQQAGSENITFQSDLYSLGALSYELFVGKKPLGRFKLPSELKPDFHKPLEEIIMSCLDPEPANRPSSADEIKDHLLKVLRGAHLKATQKERAIQGIAKIEDKFALLDIIKENQYGAVYLYEDRIDHKPLVIKKRLRASSGLTEAKLLTSLKNNNIANILGASKNEQLFIVVMEYLSGGNLKDRLIQPLPLHDVLQIGRQMCEGLAFAHRNRIVHGNLRPSNILFNEAGQVKITDFGLDEHYGDDDPGSNWYRIKEEPKSTSTDIFAAGVIFYQMMTGVLPEWKGTNLVRNTSFSKYPIELREVVARMLVRKQALRERSMDRIIAEIEAIKAECDRTAMLKSSSGFSEKTTAPAVAQKRGKQQSAWRLFWTFLLLMILSATATAYLMQTGYIKIYVGGIVRAFEKLSLYLSNLK